MRLPLSLLAVVLIGCPGPGDGEDPEADRDADGFTAAVDCDDLDPTEHPDARWYPDADLDGHGDASATPAVCERAAVTDLPTADDCDDLDPDEFPGVYWYPDLDQDGFGDPASANECERAAPTDVANADDCDDLDPDERPGALWWPDGDLDGFGDGDASPATCLRANPSDVANADDCDDADETETPDAVWYSDADADGFGDPSTRHQCLRTAETDVDNGDDCDDTDPEELPGALWYADADGDGWGVEPASGDCARANETDVDRPGDCAPTDAAVNPGRVELPGDGLDNDCVGGDAPWRTRLYTLLSPSRPGPNRVALVELDPETGEPRVVGGDGVATGGSGCTTCASTDLAITADGRYLFATNIESDSISAFSLNLATGLPTEVRGSPFTLSFSPTRLAMWDGGDTLYAIGDSTSTNGVMALISVDRGVLSVSEVVATPPMPRDIALDLFTGRLIGTYQGGEIVAWTLGARPRATAETSGAGRLADVVSRGGFVYVRSLDNGLFAFQHELGIREVLRGIGTLSMPFGSSLVAAPDGLSLYGSDAQNSGLIHVQLDATGAPTGSDTYETTTGPRAALATVDGRFVVSLSTPSGAMDVYERGEVGKPLYLWTIDSPSAQASFAAVVEQVNPFVTR